MSERNAQTINLHNLSSLAVEHLLAESLDGTHKVMDEDTLCLYDISQFEMAEYQSLIIQKTGQMYKSGVTTNGLLEDYAATLNSYHASTRLVADVLQYKHKIPYVIGERGVVPLDGYSKRPTTWIVLNHVLRVAYDNQLSLVHLVNHNDLVLSVSMTRGIFEKQLLRAASIFQFKLTLHIGRMKEYRNCYRMPSFSPPNIFMERFERLNYEEPPCTYFEAEQMVRLYHEKKRVKEILGEGNPYYDEYLDLIRDQLF